MDSNVSLADIAAVTGNNDGFGGNNAIWILALFLLFGMGGFGGYQPQYATQDFVQNGFNFNDLQDQNRDIINNITSGTAQTVAAVNQAKYDNINVAKDIQAALTAQINDVRMMEQNINNTQNECCCNILRGLDGVNANTVAQTQKILDAMAENKIEALQGRINQLELQNALAGVVRYPQGLTYNAGSSPFCSCNCGA